MILKLIYRITAPRQLEANKVLRKKKTAAVNL